MKTMLGESLPNGEGGVDREEEFDRDEEFSDGCESIEEEVVEGDEAAVSKDVRDEEMAEVMEQMDRELSVTEVGKSFEKMKVRWRCKQGASCVQGNYIRKCMKGSSSMDNLKLRGRH